MQKKGEKENLITKISWFLFTIALTTKEEEKEEDVEICKEKKNKENLNPKQPTATN